MRVNGEPDFCFSDLKESRARYDAYFENMCLEEILPEKVKGDISIDMYGMRQEGGYKRYVLSSKSLPYNTVASYGRRLRPVDANVVYDTEGRDFFLIRDSCLTELEPEEYDENGVGSTLTCIGFRPLRDDIAHAISRKYQLYR